MADKYGNPGPMSGSEFRKRDYSICRLTGKDEVKILLTGLLICAVIDYLFYESRIVFIVLAPLSAVYLQIRKRRAVKKRRQDLNRQFKDALTSLSAAVEAGYSLENAVHACARDLEQMYPRGTDIVEEFHYMESQIRLSVPAEELFQDLARRSQVEDIEDFASVISVCRYMGGDMGKVIRKCAGMISDKIDVSLEIKACVAAKKMEQNLMSLMPAGIILYLKATNPGLLESMYGNLFGACVMTVCAVIYGAAYFIGRKIVDIEV